MVVHLNSNEKFMAKCGALAVKLSKGSEGEAAEEAKTSSPVRFSRCLDVLTVCLTRLIARQDISFIFGRDVC